MRGEQFHYFIEFRPNAPASVSRLRLQNLCRETAEDFVGTIKAWAGERKIEHKISLLNVTAFGQVLIACEREVIDLIRSQNVLPIAAIRQSDLWDGGLTRFLPAGHRKSA